MDSQPIDEWDDFRPILFFEQTRPLFDLFLTTLGNNTFTRHLLALHQEVHNHAERLGRTILVVELGSWAGESAVAIAYKNNAFVICVDTWKGSSGENAPDRGYLEALPKKGDDVFHCWVKNTAHIKDQCALIRSDTVEAAALHLERGYAPVDLLFVDADHSYDATKADILSWLPNLSEDAVLIGHDYRSRQFPGVEQAVHEIFGEENVETLAMHPIAGGLWKARKTDARRSTPDSE